jgi:hypothetical protein
MGAIGEFSSDSPEEVIMLRSILILASTVCLVMCLTAWPVAGNRADINADQQVDAADAAILANLLAGNLDLAGYDLANVVVVAPQGGDFTDPRAALNWVATQSPSATNRYLVLVAPGEYTTTSSFGIPSYTTLKGYDRANTRILRTGVFFVYTSSAEGVAIQDLTFVQDHPSGAGGTMGIYFGTCTNVRISRVDIAVSDAVSASPRAFTFSDCSDVRLEHVNATVTGLPSCTSNAYGLISRGAGMQIRDCTIEVRHERTGTGSFALEVEDPGSGDQPDIRVWNSNLYASTASGGSNFYLHMVHTTFGWIRLFHCQLDGVCSTSTQIIRAGCFNESGASVP